MRQFGVRRVRFLLSIALCLCAWSAPRTGPPVSQRLGKLPLAFEVNQGQADPEVRFLSRGPGGCVSLTDSGALVAWGRTQARMKLAGANPHPAAEGVGPLPGKSNYFIGNDPAKWRTNVPSYSAVRYRDVYPGVNLVFHGTGENIEYDLELAPGADPKVIRIAWDGVDHQRIDSHGDLILTAGGRELRQRKPVVYQETKAGRTLIAGRYVGRGGRELGVALGKYDRSLAVVVDPVLEFATYVGGSGDDYPSGLAVDASGAVYVAGQTSSSNFPVATAFMKTGLGFILKLDPTGSSLLYSTYLGGSNYEHLLALALDKQGNVIVTGTTASTDFPLVNPFQSKNNGGAGSNGGPWDAFVAKLDASGSKLVYSTYLGGYGADFGYAVAVDATGNACVTGQTYASDFPVANGYQMHNRGNGDAFVTKLSPAGAMVWSTFLGSSLADAGQGIAVDSSGNVFVTGHAGTTDFPLSTGKTLGGTSGAFATKLSADGKSLMFSTILGGNGNDEGNGIAVDAAGNAYLVGTTRSLNFPVVNALQPVLGGGNSDAFVAKINAQGNALLYSTNLGGEGDEYGYSIAVDSAGNAYVGGSTTSTKFPLASPFQSSPGAGFVAELNPAGSALLFSTYLGATARAVAVDVAGSLYAAASTSSANLTTTPGAFSTKLSGGVDAYIAKISGLPGALQFLVPVSAASFAGTVSAPESIVSVFGTSLAPGTVVATSAALPTTLGNTTVTVTDSGGTDYPAPLFFVSAGQINFEVPAAVKNGIGRVTVRSNGQVVASGVIHIDTVSPALFTSNASGSGVAAALWLRVQPDGAQTVYPVYTCGATAGSCTATPFDLGPAADQIFLELYGTGIRGCGGAPAVTATIGGVSVPVAGEAAQGQYAGLDQVNLSVPRSLIASGEVNVVLTVSGKAANTVTVSVGGTLPAPVISALSPSTAQTGQSISSFTITGQNLSRASAVQFTPAAGISVGALQVTDTSITAPVSISYTAAVGARQVTVVTPGGQSNALEFDVTQGPAAPQTSQYLPIQTGMSWTYSVQFPAAVSLPYQPIFEVPDGLICASTFCGTGQWSAGTTTLTMTVGGPVAGSNPPSWSVTLGGQAEKFYFFTYPTAPPLATYELRVRTTSTGSQLELVDNFPMTASSTWRFYRPLAAVAASDIATATPVTVAAGTFANAVKTTLPFYYGLTNPVNFPTDVYLAPNVGIVKAVMKNSAGTVLFTQELTAVTGGPSQ